jgi:hypothetical protein
MVRPPIIRPGKMARATACEGTLYISGDTLPDPHDERLVALARAAAQDLSMP